MTEPVKGEKRAYRSAVRDEQAAATRARILDAAWTCFEAEGYGRTTIKQVAGAAGVAVDTVYAVFGSKIRILTALVDRRLAPQGEANVLDRAEAEPVREEPDQRTMVRRFAHDMAAVSARVRPVYELLRTAAAVEPDAGAVFHEMDAQRLMNMRGFVTWLAALGPLRVDDDRAAELVWTLASPDVGRLLCDVRGWTLDAHADWLADALTHALLP